LVGGGAERTLVNLLNKLDYSKYDVDLVVVCKTGVYVNSIPNEVRVTFLTKSLLITRVFAFFQKKYKTDFFFKWLIIKKDLGAYDLGISFIDGNFTNLLFDIKSIRRRITFVHGSYLTNPNFFKFYVNRSYVQYLKRTRYSKLDSICFVSNDCKNEFIQIFGLYPKMPVLYNVINSDNLQFLAGKFQVERNSVFTFIAVGSLLQVKNYNLLIRACKLLKSNAYEFEVWILGVGPDLERLTNLINLLELEENVHLLGFKSNPYPYIKTADAFVMSSLSEALPTVLCEAMLLGRPVVSAKASGCNEILGNNEYGLLAEQNEESLAEKMALLIEDRNMCSYYSSQSLKRSASFEDKITLLEYEKLFNENCSD
jgi:glycosyltransferase involved in cell wall biosynthesis